MVRLSREWFPVFLTIVVRYEMLWLPVFLRMLDVVVQWEELRQQDIFVSRLANRLRQMLRSRAESPVTNNSSDQRDVFTDIEDNRNLDGNENTEFIARDIFNF